MFFSPRESHRRSLAHACHFLASHTIDVNCISHFKLSTSIIMAAALSLSPSHTHTHHPRRSLACTALRKNYIFRSRDFGFDFGNILDRSEVASEAEIQNHSFHLINTLELAKFQFGKQQTHIRRSGINRKMNLYQLRMYWIDINLKWFGKDRFDQNQVLYSCSEVAVWQRPTSFKSLNIYSVQLYSFNNRILVVQMMVLCKFAVLHMNGNLWKLSDEYSIKCPHRQNV